MRAVLFDFDGTLLDSFDDIVAAVNHTLEASGRGRLPEATVRGYIGDGLADMVRRALTATGDREPTGDEVEVFIERYRPWYAEHWLDRSGLYPGASDLIDDLAARGDRLALVSNKSESACRGLLDALAISERFGAVTGGDTYPRRKPDPTPVLRTLEVLGVSPDQGVMIGDGPQDIGAGRAAGVRTIGVGWGLHPAERLREAGADQVVDSFDDLRAALGLEPLPLSR